MALGVLLNDAMETVVFGQDATSPWAQHNEWRTNSEHKQILTLRIQSNDIQLTVRRQASNTLSWLVSYQQRHWEVKGLIEAGTLHANVDGHQMRASFSHLDNNYRLFTAEHALSFSKVLPDYGMVEDHNVATAFIAPMNGTVVAQLVQPDDVVKKGDGIVVIEAMKMEQTLVAPSDGKVTEFYYSPGELVEGGATLVAFEANED